MPTLAQEQITDAQLSKYARLIYDRTGIRVSPQKKTLLSNRIRRRLKETGIDGYEAYLNQLRKLKPNQPEWDRFLQEITTHETYLFRDETQWKWFREEFLPECVSRSHETGKRSLRIWSAAASTGDEAATVASCIAGHLPNFSAWNIQIVGTDIGIGALEEAKAAVFGQRAMRLVPESLSRRFFTKAKDANVWQAKPMLTDMMTFRQHNLMDPLREHPFDLVILKNVLIYFDKTSKQQVVTNLLEKVRPGGLLLCGAAEGVSDFLKGLERIHPWLYRQPDTTR
ncbi:MAG: protein-glutamate O-methyltransferase CheR [Planctomycetes bacterium]|nr:protein-glutamate O-methyltransferase CheR [Planctomycetota bacterium]